MKNIILHVDSVYAQNEIFNKNSYLNRDDCLSFYRKLKEEFNNIGCDINTQNQGANPTVDCVIFLDIPKSRKTLERYPKKTKKVVLLFESEVIKKWNWDKKRHSDFDLIFTWNDDLVDNEKYFKFNFSVNPNNFKKFDNNSKKYDLVLFCGNHVSSHNNELYSVRRNLIYYFEKNKDIQFKFWGAGWRTKFKKNKLNYIKQLIKFKIASFKKFNNYCGLADNKLEILKVSRFNFCIENANGYNGYITEKIFDSFRAGCIPVYTGPPNISRYIPDDCYIDYSKFNSISEFVNFIKNMSSETEQAYINRIEAFNSKIKNSEFDEQVITLNIVRETIKIL